jgi:16S rRNA (adenine1518-N6/adenine1519-N6)-dimethyltransferase
MKIKPKKSLGQNFLFDHNVIKKIISLAEIKKKNIIEIGPGTGNLTKEIIKHKPKSLILIEKDKKLCELLKSKTGSENKLNIFNEDILKFNLEKKIKKNTVIFGNLPYNVSTQILIKLIKFKYWLPNYNKLILMFQKEVAERILAKHKSSKYGRLTVISNWRLKAIDHFNISKNCFYPKPKVDSTVIVFKPIINELFKIDNLLNLEKVTQIFFSSKRKMINKAFNKLFNNTNNYSKELKVDLSSRPNELSTNQYYKITEYYEKYGKIN